MKNNFRQKLHLEPVSGWLNDPNGLCFFKGNYHVYFQYSPDSAEGKGRKCWGHFQSPDLLHWRFTGTVLFPDTPDDRSGVYSGCGFVKSERLYLFYTGNVKEEGDHDYITSGRGANVILVTTEDGHNMSPKKTLLRNSDYPDYCSCHVRDPKVWEQDGRYHMILGARTLDNKGCVLYYISDDLENWTYDRTVFGGDGSYMWECPDTFTIDGHTVLSVSPQGIPHAKYMYQNIYSSGYFNADGEPKDYREWDCGFDFYAPQSFTAPDGRRLFIGWEGIGDIPYSNATTASGWQHCLTIPRELSAGENGAVRQTPIRELEQLRSGSDKITGDAVILSELPFEFIGEPSDSFTFTLENVLTISYERGELSLVFDNENAGCGRERRLAKIGKLCTDIRVIADMSSVEIYADKGETVMSSRMYPEDTEVTIHFSGISGTLYKLNGMEVTSDE